MVNSPAVNRHHAWLGCILVAAFIARAGWTMRLPADDASLAALPDQREYLQLGRNLLHGGTLNFHDKRFDDEVYAYRMPGYPALIATCGGQVRIIRIVQSIFDALTALAVYLLARRWLDRRPALFATLLAAGNPFLIYFCGLVLSETLFIAMLAWGMMLLTCGSGGCRARSAGDGARCTGAVPAIAGLLVLALAVHVRPSAILLPILAPLVLSRNWQLPIIGAILIFIVLLPWALRNQRVLGERIWTTTNSGVTLYDGFNPAADGSSNQSFLQSLPHLRTLGEIDRSRYLSARAQDYIMSQRGHVARLTIRKIARTWSPIPLSGQFGSNTLYVIAGGGFSVVLFMLIALGLWLGRLPKRVALFLMLPAIYFTVVHALSVGSLRYRIPADVPMSVVAAVGGLRVLRFRVQNKL